MSPFASFAARHIDAGQLHDGLKRGNIALVDVRESEEHQAERIEGAVNLPLSRFDPKALPTIQGQAIVLHCAGGVRSAKALNICHQSGVEVRGHLTGGINAWKAAGLPTVR
ncbi:MAG TPA: rhodanese-like domain-containing protein [Asticcacaulis sp.]|jgi:rhodanese-related sulfurtransferase|nr:rhodanese-like domain-containing protein [Asticcacaulis sp.]